jgi:hypothetical protein
MSELGFSRHTHLNPTALGARQNFQRQQLFTELSPLSEQ